MVDKRDDIDASATMSSLSINELPTEILQKTLRYLPPLDLIRCRRVSSRWRDVADSLVDEELWRQLCKQDFPSIYKNARLKCDPGLSWHELYKSLHLWAKLDLVVENWIPICSYSKEDDGASMVCSIEGKICVRNEKCNKIVYYDLKGEKVKEFNTESEYKFFKETESVIAYAINVGPRFEGTLFEMVIVKKKNGEPDLGSKVVFGNVTHFEIVGEDVYYRQYDEELGNFNSKILVSKAKDNYESTFVSFLYSDTLEMVCMNDTLYVLLNRLKVRAYYYISVWALEKDKFIFKENVESTTTRYILKTFFPCGEALLIRLSDEAGFIRSVCYFYGDMTLLAGADGILRLYNSKDFLDNPVLIEPICQFDIASKIEGKKGEIRDVDIIEKANGHIILVAVEKGVFALELKHSSKGRIQSAQIKKQNLISTEPENIKKAKLSV